MQRFCLQIIACWLIGMVIPASAAEPARAFLDGLRARGYHDIALDYLQSLQTNPAAPEDLKEAIEYERGVTLIDASRSQNDPKLRTKYLSDAETALKAFAKAKPDSPQVNAARSQLAGLIAERARMSVQQANDGGGPKLLQQATKQYNEAAAVLAELNKSVNAELDKIPKVLDSKDRKQAALIQQRTQLRADNLQTQLLAAAIREESAETVPAGSPEQKKYLIEAATLYDEIYKEYRTRLAGLYARMYQGRCNQRLGRLRDALGYYGELLDQPDEPDAFRVLKTKTLRLAMECWLDNSQQKYLEAIKQGDRWIGLARPHEDREPDWLAIRLSLAKAYKMQADDAGESDKRLVSRSIAEARTHAEAVAKVRSEFQDEARRLAARLGGPEDAQVEFVPENFEDAKVAGQEALQAIASSDAAVQQVAGELAAAKDEAAKKSLQEKLKASQAAAQGARDKAMRFFRTALSLADRETPQSEVNFVRYFMCYLYYLEQKPFEAALMGEFVARRHPTSAGAVPSAKIALASYVTLYDQADAADADFEAERITTLAMYIADTWPKRPEAAEALTTVIPFVINDGDLPLAKQLTQRIPAGSAGRLLAELQTGQAMWGRYITHSQQVRTWEQEGAPEGTDLAKERAELETLQKGTIELLSAAFASLAAKGPADTTTVTAMLSLAQAYVETLQGPKAVEVLENGQVGPLTLVDKKDPSVSNPVMIEETYRTALRAYIGSLGENGDAMMEKAKGVMTSMQQAVADDEAGTQRMLSVYISLAQDIERQMKAAQSDEDKRALSVVFEAFLEQLSSGSSDLNVLNWVAETFSSLGAGFTTDGAIGPDAKKYYDQSIAAFDNMLQRPDLPEGTATQIKLRMAQVQATTGAFDAALAIFEEVLAKNAMMLNVQVEAAKLLQDWGQQDADKYLEAMNGPGSAAPSVWGWAKIGKTTITYPQFRNTFYEARYEYARSALALAASRQGADKDKLLSNAERSLSQTQRLYPTLGGDQWPTKYDETLKEIQTAQGKPAVGLPNIPQPTNDADSGEGQ
ncbi:hypothetical protein Poly24_54050 [Rosistilla carotiformis]|uniref:Tetratricopeptide repeat protein n=1 Tax=Rosistilla carotiformis TaxID=2528017 RepID=A0A518K1H7_9BACT|nr:hypothetical protein [Rosistilla carotiformis]QDV71666.1 hypothetical protein Poly24_54050 [Rosistilla carotiformis]